MAGLIFTKQRIATLFGCFSAAANLPIRR